MTRRRSCRHRRSYRCAAHVLFRTTCRRCPYASLPPSFPFLHLELDSHMQPNFQIQHPGSRPPPPPACMPNRSPDPQCLPSFSAESTDPLQDGDDYKMMVLHFSHDTTEEEVDRHFLRAALDLGITVPQDPSKRFSSPRIPNQAMWRLLADFLNLSRDHTGTDHQKRCSSRPLLPRSVRTSYASLENFQLHSPNVMQFERAAP